MVKRTARLIFLVLCFLFINISAVNALPWGTLLYKTSENGRMYGYNELEFPFLPGEIYDGSVAIYVGNDKQTGLPMLVEAAPDFGKVVKMPAKYFVDLDKGEKFIGAKIPDDFKYSHQKACEVYELIYNQLNERFDYTYQKQKGPYSGEWTAAGLIEKIYESSGSTTLVYHQQAGALNLTQYTINITPDGYDNSSEINGNYDVFSRTAEFSKVHRLGQGNFWEKFFIKEAQDLIAALQSSLSDAVNKVIGVNIFGKKYEGNRYFFFPYTQFVQSTLKDVSIDIEVASSGRSNLEGVLSPAARRTIMIFEFSSRILKELSFEKLKDLASDFLGIRQLIAAYKSVQSNISMFEEGTNVFTGGEVNIDIDGPIKKKVAENETISGALGVTQKIKQYANDAADEYWETAQLVKKGWGSLEYEKDIQEGLAALDFNNETINKENIEEVAEYYEETKDPEKEKIQENLNEKLETIIKEEDADLSEKENKKQKNPEKKEQEIDKDKLPIKEILLPQYFPGNVVINELVANPAEGANEWIELYNNTNQTIDLSNWTIEDNTAKPKSLKNLTINPKSWLVLNNGQHFSFNLNNSGDIIKLKYKDVLINQVCYGDFDDGNINDNAPTAAKEQSLARKNNQDTDQDKNDWAVTSLPTPGLMNKIIVPVSEPIIQPQNSSGGGGGGSSSPNYQSYQMGNVVINEIMYNPSGSDTGHEWIEIYNTTSENIDLTNWKFYEAKTNHGLNLEQGSLILPVGGYAIIADNSSQFLIDHPNFNGTIFKSSFSLNNTSETIALKDGQGNLINELTYSSQWGGDDNGKTIEKQTNGSYTESSVDKGTPSQSSSSPVVQAQSQTDTTPPDITGLSNDTTPTKSKTWSWNSSDSTAQFRYVIDRSLAGVPTGEYGDIKTASQSTGDGIYYLHVQAKDNLGNESEIVTVSAVLDNTPPIAQIRTKPDNPTNQTTANITIGGDGVTYYKYKLDNGIYSIETDVSTHIVLSGLSNGKYTIYVIGRDAAGNWQSQENPTIYSWTIESESNPEPEPEEFLPSYSSNDAIINEIMYNPSGSDTGHEWIEIYNTTSENIDLTNWKFYEAKTNHGLNLEQGSLILPVGGYAIIADNSSQFLIDHPNFNGTIFKSSFSLNNTSETIIIKDGQGNIINQITYLSEWGGDDNNKTIEKKSDGNWRESSEEKGTPGEQNSSSVNNPEDESLMDTILPSAQAGPDQTAEINQSINLDGSGSTDNVGIVSYQWDVNKSDGLDWANPDLTSPTPTLESGYSAAGTYVVTLRVADEAGNVASDTLTITISNSSQYQSYSSLDVVISEVAWMGTKADYYDEWIELYNNLNQSVDLSGWRLKAVDGTPDIALVGQISAHGYWLLERTDNTTISNIEADQIYIGVLGNSGESLELIDGTGQQIDFVNQASGWLAGDKYTKASMERISPLVSGNELTNWQTNNGQEIFGLDAETGPIFGTPKQKNSQKIEGVGGEELEDITPPETTIENFSQLPNLTNLSTITFQFSSSENDSTFECKLDSPTWQSCSSPKTYSNLSEGKHTFQVRAIDSVGNINPTPAQFSWTIDFSGPQVTITSQPINPTNQARAQIEFFSSESVVFECSLDRKGWQTCSSPKVYENLADDLHLFSLRAKNSVNNYSQPIDITWLIDTIPPEIEIIKKPNNLTNQTSAIFEFSAREEAIFSCRLDDKEWQICSSLKIYENLDKGLHQFQFRAEDLANNQSTIDYQWTIDLTKPISSIDSSFDGSYFNASSWPGRIIGTASDPNNNLDKVEIQIQKGLETQYLDNSNATLTLTWIDSNSPPWLEAILDSNATSSIATWHFDLPVSLLTDDYYFIRSQAFDSLDNAQNATSTADFIFDDTAPEKVVGLKIEEGDNSLDFTLFWDTANDNLSGIDYYQIWDEENNWNSGNTTSTAEVTLNLTGENSTDYSFKVRACDKAGNCGEFSDSQEYKIEIQPLIIFEDSFDDGDTSAWQEMDQDNCINPDFICPSNAWRVENGRYIVELENSTLDYAQSLAGDTAWQDYQFDVDLTFYNGVDRYIIFRYQNSEHYYLINFRGYWPYMKPNTPAIYLYKVMPGLENGEETYLAISRFPGQYFFNEEREYHLTVAVQGKQLQIYLDGELVIDYQDQIDPILNGKIGFAVWTGDEGTGKMSIDNVVVRPVVEPLNLPPISIPQLFDNFDDGQPDGWRETGPDNAWRIEDGQYVLDMNSQNLKAESVVGNYSWQDYQIDLDVTLIDGVDRYILFRRADNKNYYRLNFMGQWTWPPKLSLGRTSTQSGDDILKEVLSWPDIFNNGEKHHLKIMIQGEKIKVYLDGEAEPIIDVEDQGIRLTHGNIALGGWTGHYGRIVVYWDNIQINPL